MTKKRVTMPPGCKCQPYDWAGVGEIRTVCDEYTGCGDLCYDCSHNPECHAVAVADEGDNRPADERDVDSLQEIVGLLLYRLGRAAKENASLKEQLADRGERNKK